MRNMKMSLPRILIFLCVVATLAAGENLKPGDYTFFVEAQGRTRSYLVHVPRSSNGAKAASVVLAFHGGGSNGRTMITFSGLNDKSDEAGFIAVYPDGTGRRSEMLTWNAGYCCGHASREDVDDIGFVDKLLDDLSRRVSVDPNRIYATGMSNGAMMCYRLASELSNRIAAVAPVSGPMGTETCNPKRPVSVMHFHGTDDKFAPYAGGRGDRSLTQTDFLSVDYSISAWVKANGCPERGVTTKEPNRANDGMIVTRTAYGPGRDGAEVILIAIRGGGHTWPGRDCRLAFLGKSTHDISANDLMWDFFQKHPMR